MATKILSFFNPFLKVEQKSIPVSTRSPSERLARAFNDVFSRTSILNAEGTMPFGDYLFTEFFDAGKLLQCTFDEKSQKFTLSFKEAKQTPISRFPPSLKIDQDKQIPLQVSIAQEVRGTVSSRQIHFEPGSLCLRLKSDQPYAIDLTEMKADEKSPDSLYITPQLPSSIPFMIRAPFQLMDLTIHLPAQELFDALQQ